MYTVVGGRLRLELVSGSAVISCMGGGGGLTGGGVREGGKYGEGRSWM